MLQLRSGRGKQQVVTFPLVQGSEFSDITPVMDNQMEENMEHIMGTTIHRSVRSYVPLSKLLVSPLISPIVVPYIIPLLGV